MPKDTSIADLIPKSSPSATSHGAEDLRVRRTRRLLTQALLELARERPFETITARDLTDRAEVGYATFFRHYSNPADLLRSVVDDLLTDLLDLLPPLTGSEPQQASILIFRHAREHAELYRLLLRTDHSLDLLANPVQVGLESLYEAYETKPNSRVPLEVAATHFIHSFIHLIRWWLDNDMPYEPERMGEIYQDLILRPTEEVALRPRLSRSPS